MYGYDIQKTIFTVMDADSEFHEERNGALPHYFEWKRELTLCHDNKIHTTSNI